MSNPDNSDNEMSVNDYSSSDEPNSPGSSQLAEVDIDFDNKSFIGGKWIQHYFENFDEPFSRVSFCILSKTKLYAFYSRNKNENLARVADYSFDGSKLYEKMFDEGLKYICDHAFGEHIAILFQTSCLEENKKFCLQIYNDKLTLLASKYFSYQINPVYMNMKEIFCLSINTPCVHVFDFRLNEKKLFLNHDKQISHDCFKHRSFWICGATDEKIYVDNRSYGLDIICRKTGEILKTILNDKSSLRSTLPCARVDSSSSIIAINDFEKMTTLYDENGRQLYENSLENIDGNLSDCYLFSTVDDEFYLIKQIDENAIDLKFFKPNLID